MITCVCLTQGRRQKIFQEGGNGKKDRKFSKKMPKNSTNYLFQGGGPTEKRPKNSKKSRKIALLSSYL